MTIGGGAAATAAADDDAGDEGHDVSEQCRGEFSSDGANDRETAVLLPTGTVLGDGRRRSPEPGD
jgi:hypothetical protein